MPRRFLIGQKDWPIGALLTLMVNLGDIKQAQSNEEYIVIDLSTEQENQLKRLLQGKYDNEVSIESLLAQTNGVTFSTDRAKCQPATLLNVETEGKSISLRTVSVPVTSTSLVFTMPTPSSEYKFVGSTTETLRGT